MSTPENTKRRGSFAVWPVVTWLLLLFAIIGVFFLSTRVWSTTPDRGWWWNVAELAFACIVVSASFGAIMRRAWARRALRIIAVVLALWLLATAFTRATEWLSFSHHMAQVYAQPGMGAAGALYARIRLSYMVVIALQAAAVPVLAWLAWRLGKPAVRAQFSPPRNRR